MGGWLGGWKIVGAGSWVGRSRLGTCTSPRKQPLESELLH